jgi:dTDP-4-amino-4,6-dideoxygalactose transaminase
MHAWHLYAIRLKDDSPVTREEFIDQMAALGIGTSVHFIPLHLHPYWRDTYNLRREQFPNATRAFEKIVSLPLYTRMTDADQDRVIKATRSILDHSRRSFVAAGTESAKA